MQCVLAVDDSPSIRSLTNYVLEQAGFGVVMAAMFRTSKDASGSGGESKACNILPKKIVSTLIISLFAATLGACDAEDTINSPAKPALEFSNSPPTISGNPLISTKVGQAYSFEPTASDPDADALYFSIQNQPSWASFDTETGKLSGIPQQKHLGAYANITITASDGELSAQLNGFSVDVVHAGVFSVTLSWIPPTENIDGSYLSDLAGYKIYYGVSEGNYPNVIIIDNPGIATYVVENLTPATYFFVATAVSSNGLESEFSNVAIKVIS